MIDSFKAEYAFLSNFYMTLIYYEGIVYQSTEHAFQAAKTLNQDVRLEIAHLPTCAKAKAKGRQVNMRHDWEQVKNKVMLDLCRIKFSKNPLKSMLLSTKNEELVEGNTWNDKTWGRVKENGEWIGENRLGKTLMLVRDEIRFERF